MTRLGRRLAAFRDNLFKLGNQEPLSKLSLALIIALDIFVLIILFQGLNDHTRQLTSPEEYVPYTCQQVFIHHGWNEQNRLDELQQLVLSGYENIHYRYDSLLERVDTDIMHPACRNLYQQIKAIADDKAVEKLFIQRKDLQKHRIDLNRNLNPNRGAYDTSLLETIANQRPADQQLGSIADSSKGLSNELNEVAGKLANIDKQLNAIPSIATLWQSTSADQVERSRLVEAYKHYQLWYAVKKLLWQMLFILPIFFVFYFWSSHSVKRQHTIQTLIASHLLVVSAIPILLKLIELVIDLIPHEFFKNLFRLLEAWHLIALWHYFVIFTSVAGALGLIYLVQKKLFNQQRTLQRRLMKGECHACGLKLPPGADYCPFCGEAQTRSCPACHRTTPISAGYCTHCGKPL